MVSLLANLVGKIVGKYVEESCCKHTNKKFQFDERTASPNYKIFFVWNSKFWFPDKKIKVNVPKVKGLPALWPQSPCIIGVLPGVITSLENAVSRYQSELMQIA